MPTSASRIRIVSSVLAGAGVTPCGERSSPTGVTTAAVPQAKTSVISPEATPSRHSSRENFRSSTAWPSLPASSMIEARVMPSRIVPVSGVTMCPSAWTKKRFIPPSSSM